MAAPGRAGQLAPQPGRRERGPRWPVRHRAGPAASAAGCAGARGRTCGHRWPYPMRSSACSVSAMSPVPSPCRRRSAAAMRVNGRLNVTLSTTPTRITTRRSVIEYTVLLAMNQAVAPSRRERQQRQGQDGDRAPQRRSGVRTVMPGAQSAPGHEHAEVDQQQVHVGTPGAPAGPGPDVPATAGARWPARPRAGRARPRTHVRAGAVPDGATAVFTAAAPGVAAWRTACPPRSTP